jgi:hypothetical protein
LHPNEAIRGAITVIFERFAQLGSARHVWLWLRREGLRFPLQTTTLAEIRWVVPTYHQVHPGFVDRETFETFEANQQRIARNTRPRAHEPGGAVRDGAALLQGIAVCGRYARKLAVHYGGRGGRSGYHCPGRGGPRRVVPAGRWRADRRGRRRGDAGGLDASLASRPRWRPRSRLRPTTTPRSGSGSCRSSARYDAQRAERRYRAVEPEHRLVARGLERDWEQALGALVAEAELERRQHARLRTLSAQEREQLLALGADLGKVWSAPTITDRDRK